MKPVQNKISFSLSNLGKVGRQEWSEELRRETIDLQEVNENMWRWRNNGGGKKSNKKLKFLEELLDKERQGKDDLEY